MGVLVQQEVLLLLEHIVQEFEAVVQGALVGTAIAHEACDVSKTLYCFTLKIFIVEIQQRCLDDILPLPICDLFCSRA